MPVKWKATVRWMRDRVDTVHYSYDTRPARPDNIDNLRRWTLEKRERGTWTVVERYDAHDNGGRS